VRNIYRSGFVAGLLLISGLMSLLAVAPVGAATAPAVQIIQVVDARTVAEESFQLYNNTGKSATLDGYQICPGTATCIKVPTTTVDAFRFVEISASKLTGWPASGLNGTADMLGLLGPDGKPMDAVNWGTPDPAWKNYPAFKDLLYNPGITPPSPGGKQNFFRTAPGLDNRTVKDWLAISLSGGPETTPTAGPKATGTAAPAATAVRTATRTPVAGSGGATVNQTPTTGGEFPFFITVALVLAVLVVRYMRVRRSSPSR